MKTGSIDLTSSQVAPPYGFKPNGSKFSIALYCADLGASSIDFTLKAKTGEIVGFGNVKREGAYITDTLASGVAEVFSFDTDVALVYCIEFDSGTSGTLTYEIIE